MGLIAGKCTNCGAKVEFDESMKKGFCMHCGTPFIAEQIVQNNTQNIQITNAVFTGTHTADNYVERAKQHQKENDMAKAVEYANKALDINANHEDAKKILDMQFDICGKTIGYEKFMEAVGIAESHFRHFSGGGLINTLTFNFGRKAFNEHIGLPYKKHDKKAMDSFYNAYKACGAYHFLIKDNNSKCNTVNDVNIYAFGVLLTAEQINQIKMHLINRNMIQAIKDVANWTRVGLRDAKDFVDHWSTHGEKSASTLFKRG